MWEDALKAAKRSTIKRFKTGAAIYDKNGHLLATGCSHVPEQSLSSTPWSKHAEHDAIHRAGPAIRDAHSIVIATLSKKGNVTSALPCESCARLIGNTSIQEIHASKKES